MKWKKRWNEWTENMKKMKKKENIEEHIGFFLVSPNVDEHESTE